MYSSLQTLNLVSQNVSKEILLTGFKIQAKILRPSGDCVLERRSAVYPPSNGEGLSDIQHSMSRILGTTFFYLIHYDRFLQNAYWLLLHYKPVGRIEKLICILRMRWQMYFNSVENVYTFIFSYVGLHWWSVFLKVETRQKFSLVACYS